MSNSENRETRLAELKLREVQAQRKLGEVAESYSVARRALDLQRTEANKLAATCQTGETFLTAIRSQIEFSQRNPNIDGIVKSLELQKQAEMLEPFHAAAVKKLDATKKEIERLEKLTADLPREIEKARNSVAERHEAFYTMLTSGK